MAQFKPILGQIIGSVQGVTIQNTSTGFIIRGKPKSTNPQTPAQTLQRNLVAATAGEWSGILTEDQRADWNSLAATATRYDKFGDPYTPSGYQIYNEANNNLRKCGLDTLQDAPDNLYVAGTPFFDFLGLGYQCHWYQIENVDIPLPSDHSLVGSCAINISPGATAWARSAFFCGVGYVGGPADLFKFDFPPAIGYGRLGKYCYVSIQLISTLNGMVSVAVVKRDLTIIP